MPPPDRLLNAREAAAYLGMSLDGLYAWRKRHGIKNAIPGRALRFRASDLVRAHLDDFPPERTVLDFAELGRQHARGGLQRA